MSTERTPLSKPVLTHEQLRAWLGEVEQQFGRVAHAPTTLPQRSDVCWSLGFRAAIRMLGDRLGAAVNEAQGASDETAAQHGRECFGSYNNGTACMRPFGHTGRCGPPRDEDSPEQASEHLYVPVSSGNDTCQICENPKRQCTALNGN
jgi:hypothetical protein